MQGKDVFIDSVIRPALPLRFKPGEPPQGPQSRHEAVLAATGDDKARQSLQTLSDRTARNCKTVPGLNRADDRILVAARSKENAVIDPLRLDELELPSKVRAHEGEHQSTVDTVILELAFRKQGAVCGSPSDHAVNFRDAGDRRVARVRASDVRTPRRFETRRVILFKEEIVVTPGIGAKFRIIVNRTERERRAASPASHHLCGKKFLAHFTRRIRFQVFAKVRDSLMELAKNNVRPVSTEQLRFGLLDASQLIRLAENELACLEGLFFGIASRNPTSFNCGMADAVPESEGLLLIR
jgi:hypothetical protein